MAGRTYLGSGLVNLPGKDARRGRYYSISAVWMSADEFQLVDSGSVGLSDFHREGSDASTLLYTLFSTLRVSIPSTESSGVDCFFLQIPDVGYCFLICCTSFKYFEKWSISLRQALVGSNVAVCRRISAEKIPIARLVTTFVAQINATFHSSFAHSFLSSAMYQTFGDVDSCTRHLRTHHQAAADQAQGEEPPDPDGAATAAHTTIVSTVLNTMDPISLLNPLLAMSIHRTLVSENLYALTGDASLSYLASDIEGSIFDAVPGYIDFSRVPANVRVFPIAIEQMAPAYLFPGVLPCRTQLIRYFEQCGLHDVSRAAARLSDSALATAIIMESPIDPHSPHSGVFFNPIGRMCMVKETDVRVMKQMPYLTSAADSLALLRSDAEIDAPTIRTAFVRTVASCIRQMASGDSNTPRSINCAASIVLDGLSTIGLHSIPPSARLSETGAWIAWALSVLNAMNVSRQHTSVGLRWMESTLTTFVSAHGGYHIALSGMPSDGKTYTINTLMRMLAPYMEAIMTASQQAFTSRDAMESSRGIMFVDEADRNSIPPSVMKILAGRETESRRARNDDFKKGERAASDGTIPTLAIVLATNLDKASLFADRPEGGRQKPTYGRPRSEYSYGSSSSDTRTSDPVSDALHSRFGFFSLRGSTIPISEMLGRIDESGTSARIAKTAAPLTFFYNVAVVICTLVREGVITPPISFEKASIIQRLHDYFIAQRGNIPQMDNRTPVRFTTTALVSAILEQVYERIMQGGEHIPTATVEQLSELIYDISLSVVPTKENILFGAAMVYEAMLDSLSGKDLLPAALLDALSAARPLSIDIHTYDITMADTEVLAQKVRMTPDGLRERLNRMVHEKLVVRDASSVGDDLVYSNRTVAVARYESTMWEIDPAFLRSGISVNDVFDACALNAATDGLRFEYFGRSVGDLRIRVSTFLDRLMKLIIAHPLMSDSSPIDCATLACTQLQHRIFMKLIVPSELDLVRPWWRRLTQRYITERVYADENDETPHGATFTLTATYLTILQDSDDGESLIVRAFRTVVTEPSEIPLLVPSNADVKLPEVLVVGPDETAPYWDIKYTPGEFSAEGSSGEVHTFHGGTTDEHPPHAFALWHRAVKDYHISPRTDTELEELLGHLDVRRFAATHNLIAGSPPPTISKFRLNTRANSVIVAGKFAQLDSINTLMARMRGEQYIAPAHPPSSGASPASPPQLQHRHHQARASDARASPSTKQKKTKKKTQATATASGASNSRARASYSAGAGPAASFADDPAVHRARRPRIDRSRSSGDDEP